MKAQLVDIKVFGVKETKKAVFLTTDYDKIEVLINDKQYPALLAAKGKAGVLALGFTADGYNYKLSFNSFTAAA